MSRLDEFLDGVCHLPPAPTVLPELLRRLSKPDVDNSEIVALLSFDPGLTTAVLRVANSAFFGASEPASSLQEAITRLGYHQVLLLVATICGSTTLSHPHPAYALEPGELWRHSVAAALAAENLAHQTGEDANVVFTAALLHDIGKIILSDALAGKGSYLVTETESQRLSLRECERRLLGVEHAEIGGCLLARWNFAPALVAAITHHHDPAAAAPHERLAASVYLGNLIAHTLGLSSGSQAFALRERPEALSLLGLKADRWPEYILGGLARFRAMKALVNVSQRG
jgi:putative nucleotidyltransferase with HDIG domain